jgi:hypothetical protein
VDGDDADNVSGGGQYVWIDVGLGLTDVGNFWAFMIDVKR